MIKAPPGWINGTDIDMTKPLTLTSVSPVTVNSPVRLLLMVTSLTHVTGLYNQHPRWVTARMTRDATAAVTMLSFFMSPESRLAMPGLSRCFY